MKAGSATSFLFGCTLALAACGSGSGDGGQGAGGTSATGGSHPTGGTSATGGAPGTGGGSGGTATGGTLGTGGSATGGRSGTGGVPATGGSPGTGGVATGGSPGSGGGTPTGGRGAAGTSGGGTGPGVGGRAGSPGTGGTAGASGGKQTVCQFASGLNVAWVNFAGDIPNPNIATFNTIFKNTYNAGGRVIRWWFHTNGTVTPGYNSDGTVKEIPQSHIDGVKAILNAAHSNGVAIDISLWSFDMLQSNAGNAHTQNQQLLENDTIRASYVNNYLTKLVTALRGTPGLYSYEIFNEPEGMGPKGWATYRTTEAAIQKCVNWFADAIHAADPDVLVTNGAVTFDYCSNVSGKTNYYSDDALRNVGGKQNGTLDFYEVHYYTSNGVSNSAFMNPASHWGLDKKLVMGEFAAADTDGVAKDSLYTHLYDAGYSGAWAWSYDADWPWPAMQAGMQNVYNAHTSVVGACP
ncbi:MAG TPA: hypothetical protein VHM31_15395 [Polyangia bacterium]|nr:hypothetical protein [Polyangia bacterium]